LWQGEDQCNQLFLFPNEEGCEEFENFILDKGLTVPTLSLSQVTFLFLPIGRYGTLLFIFLAAILFYRMTLCKK